MKRYLTSLAVFAIMVTGAGSGVQAGSLKISIDLGKQQMHVKENGETVHTWPISSGVAGYRTVTGSFRPQYMTKMHYSRKYDDAPMPHSIFFHGGFAIHGTYATGRLGATASHGCVRLSTGNAKALYAMVQEHGRGNTSISIYGSPRDRAPQIAAKAKSKRYAQRDGDDEDVVEVRRTSRAMGTANRSVAAAAKPKLIYRNGVAYVYVGREAARRYYAKHGYSSSY